MVGRFQLIHRGHEDAINQALMVCDRILILVGSSQEQGTAKNPFDVATRTMMIKEVYPGNEVIIKSLPDMPEVGMDVWGRHVLNTVKQYLRKLPDIMVYGNDDPRSAWFVDHQYEVRNITEMIVSRHRTNISATILREYMFLDEFEKWSEWSNPKLHKHYPELRAQLLAAPGLADAVRMKFHKPEPWTDKPVMHSI